MWILRPAKVPPACLRLHRRAPFLFAHIMLISTITCTFLICLFSRSSLANPPCNSFISYSLLNSNHEQYLCYTLPNSFSCHFVTHDTFTYAQHHSTALNTCQGHPQITNYIRPSPRLSHQATPIIYVTSWTTASSFSHDDATLRHIRYTLNLIHRSLMQSSLQCPQHKWSAHASGPSCTQEDERLIVESCMNIIVMSIYVLRTHI